MSIRYVKHKLIDAQKWNAAIQNSQHPLIYGHFEYLTAITESQWDALIFGDYEVVFPLPFKKILGIKYLVQPVWCQQLGAFGNSAAMVTTDDFFKIISTKFLRVRLQFNNYFDISKNHQTLFERSIPASLKKENPGNCYPVLDSSQVGLLTAHIHKSLKKLGVLGQKNNLVLPLNQAIQYNKDCRKNLNHLKSLTVNYKINQISVEEAIGVYRVAWGSQNPTLRDPQYKLLANAYHAFHQNHITQSHSFVISAHQEAKTLGTAIFFITATTNDNKLRTLHYVCAGPTSEGRDIGIMHGIIDFVIEHFKGQNVLFDFEGSSIPSVAAFYKKFGAIEHPFFTFRSGF